MHVHLFMCLCVYGLKTRPIGPAHWPCRSLNNTKTHPSGPGEWCRNGFEPINLKDCLPGHKMHSLVVGDRCCKGRDLLTTYIFDYCAISPDILVRYLAWDWFPWFPRPALYPQLPQLPQLSWLLSLPQLTRPHNSWPQWSPWHHDIFIADWYCLNEPDCEWLTCSHKLPTDTSRLRFTRSDWATKTPTKTDRLIFTCWDGDADTGLDLMTLNGWE